ncbi:hypothetical protein FJTKL_01235 [Diaporthe vaccinii]|uniref:Uncharacterized protein n=1 Tax=Diaporthe vaccinii TaxID=105482 RepID=A0ABR4F5I9_9PEZI
MGIVFLVSLTKLLFSAAVIIFSAASLGLPIKAFPPHSLNLSLYSAFRLYSAFLFPNGYLSCPFNFGSCHAHFIVMLAFGCPLACFLVPSFLFLPHAPADLMLYLVCNLTVFSLSLFSRLNLLKSHLVPNLLLGHSVVGLLSLWVTLLLFLTVSAPCVALYNLCFNPFFKLLLPPLFFNFSLLFMALVLDPSKLPVSLTISQPLSLLHYL